MVHTLKDDLISDFNLSSFRWKTGSVFPEVICDIAIVEGVECHSANLVALGSNASCHGCLCSSLRLSCCCKFIPYTALSVMIIRLKSSCKNRNGATNNSNETVVDLQLYFTNK